MKKTLFVTGIVGMFIGSIFNMVEASENSSNSNKKTISIEYLAPTEDNRDIKTTNIDFNYLFSEREKIDLSIYVGLTATYATGSITQLEGDINAGTLREVHYDNSAFGLGPGLLGSFRLLSSNKFTIHLNGSGSFIVYNKKFPAGGDYYNFMWRGGPFIIYDIGKSKTIGIGYHWAHISNGQGVGSQNPSYDAEGIMLRFTGFF